MSKTKIAVVTGANKGLGYAIVKILCKEYSGKVYLTSRDESRGINACEELKTLGLKPEYHNLDITDSKSVLNFVKGVKDRNEEVEILVNNAGVLFLKDATESKIHQADKTILVNFFSLVIFTENTLPLMSQGGRIVNISSSSGHLSRIPSETLRKRLKSEDLTFPQLKTLMMSYLESVRQGEEIADVWGDSPYVVSKVAVNAYTFMLNRRLSDRGKNLFLGQASRNKTVKKQIFRYRPFNVSCPLPWKLAILPLLCCRQYNTGIKLVTYLSNWKQLHSCAMKQSIFLTN